ALVAAEQKARRRQRRAVPSFGGVFLVQPEGVIVANPLDKVANGVLGRFGVPAAGDRGDLPEAAARRRQQLLGDLTLDIGIGRHGTSVGAYWLGIGVQGSGWRSLIPDPRSLTLLARTSFALREPAHLGSRDGRCRSGR